MNSYACLSLLFYFWKYLPIFTNISLPLIFGDTQNTGKEYVEPCTRTSNKGMLKKQWSSRGKTILRTIKHSVTSLEKGRDEGEHKWFDKGMRKEFSWTNWKIYQLVSAPEWGSQGPQCCAKSNSSSPHALWVIVICIIMNSQCLRNVWQFMSTDPYHLYLCHLFI